MSISRIPPVIDDDNFPEIFDMIKDIPSVYLSGNYKLIDLLKIAREQMIKYNHLLHTS